MNGYNVLYYYNDFISPNLSSVEEHIGNTHQGLGEETLMNKIENEIYIIETWYELSQWCNEFGYNIENIYEQFGINSNWFL